MKFRPSAPLVFFLLVVVVFCVVVVVVVAVRAHTCVQCFQNLSH